MKVFAMLDFQHLHRGLSGSDALRRHRERTGTTGHNKLLWSEKETQTLRRLYPDYKAAMRALPGRTYWAIRGKALECGIQHPRHTWTAAEISRVRKLASRGASDKEMLAMLPGIGREQLRGVLVHYKIRRKRRPFKPTGYPLLDKVRARCDQLGWSMVDLDAIAGTRRYFSAQVWVARGHVSAPHVVKAIEALGGSLAVTWKD